MDARIQQSVVANLRSRPAPAEVGPFVIGFDPGTSNPGINYATPIPGAPITATDVAGLIATFRQADRKPRLEYVTSTAPGLEDLLLAAGFTVEERHEYLICTPQSLLIPSTPDGFALRTPADDADRMAMADAQITAFGGDGSATTEDAERMSRLQSNGGTAIMAVDLVGDAQPAVNSQTSGRIVGGRVVGGGQAVPPNDRVSEVAGIAVRKPYRRRGLAGAITAEISRTLFAGGVEIAWLEASGADSWRVYERIGYRPAGERLYISLE